LLLPLSVLSNPTLRRVISTEAANSLIVCCAVEKPALSEVEWDPRILPFPLPVLTHPTQAKNTPGMCPQPDTHYRFRTAQTALLHRFVFHISTLYLSLYGQQNAYS